LEFRPPARLLRLLCPLTALACTEPIPREVYVPAPDYQQSLAVQAVPGAEAPQRSGTPITLHAQRRTGPWRLVARDSAVLTDCWWRRPPPADEPEVAANVTWRVAPADSVRFNLPRPPNWEREVRFGRPGQYRLWAVSAGCHTPIVSDTILLEILP
jgi:hypothetical protein